MATIKSFTDLQQSKKLAEILPIESADMEYMFLKEDGSKVSNIPFVKDDDEPEWPNDSAYDFIPCWSLAALLNVLPDTITSNDGIAFKLNIKKNIIEYSNPSLYLIYKSVKSDNIVDACVEMIIKLHELNLL